MIGNENDASDNLGHSSCTLTGWNTVYAALTEQWSWDKATKSSLSEVRMAVESAAEVDGESYFQISTHTTSLRLV